MLFYRYVCYTRLALVYCTRSLVHINVYVYVPVCVCDDVTTTVTVAYYLVVLPYYTIGACLYLFYHVGKVDAVDTISCSKQLADYTEMAGSHRS